MVKICEKDGCNKEFSHTSNGFNVNIQRRKFCFDCSPFGCKNTRNLNIEKKEKKSAYSSVKKHRKNKKQKCVSYKGGQCCICGYSRCVEALEFHHLDPTRKDFQISKAGTWNMERIIPELDKCALVCSNCHREVHQGISKIPAAPTKYKHRSE